MSQFEHTQPVRLAPGGLFYRLMLRLRVVEEKHDHPWRRIFLFISITWLPLMVLTTVDNTLTGNSVSITFLGDPIPHARYFIALPLLVFAERIIDPNLSDIVKFFQISDIVPQNAKCHYEKAFQELIRRRDSA